MARRFLSTLATAAAMSAAAACGVDTAPAPETSDEMILLAAETLDQTVVLDLPLLAAEEEPPVDLDLSGAFGGSLGRPSISGGVDTSPTTGVGGPGRPQTGTGGVGEPSTGLGGVGSPMMLGTSSFAAAVCDFVAALCEYFGRCGAEAFAVSECVAFAGSQCPSFVSAALAEAGVTQVPAEAVSWINCASQRIRSQTCGPDDSVFLDAFFECLPASLRSGVPEQPEPEPQF